MRGTSGFGSPHGSPSYSTSASSSGNFGTGGFSWAVPDPPGKPEKIPVLSSRMRKITIKEEPSMEESVEKFHTTLMEGVKRMVSASFYGVLGIKVKRTKEPVLTGSIKKIKS